VKWFSGLMYTWLTFCNQTLMKIFPADFDCKISGKL
jgi:hypothetical protein